MTLDVLTTELAAGCPSPPCTLRSWYDIAKRTTLVMHGTDENPEHWLRIPDVVRVRVRRPAVIQRYVARWVRRVHEWEAQHDEAVPD